MTVKVVAISVAAGGSGFSGCVIEGHFTETALLHDPLVVEVVEVVGVVRVVEGVRVVGVVRVVEVV